MVNFDPSKDPNAKSNLDTLWEKLTEGGKVLMPLQEYPFSKHYGWVEDKFGVSWQLILTDPQGEPRPFIIPSLLFVNNALGKAEEAINFYVSVFADASVGTVARYPAGSEPDKEGTIMFSELRIGKQWFAAMDSAHKHDFNFNEGVSLVVQCDTQEEIDYYWEKLSAVPEAEQCGWLKDKFGLSWQIVPSDMDEMMSKGTPEQMQRVTKTFLPMKKFILADLRKAYKGE
jgi:predicted 3-demethylubiquinone-9 3-methyltransferase (glyoxalase superfamily)